MRDILAMIEKDHGTIVSDKVTILEQQLRITHDDASRLQSAINQFIHLFEPRQFDDSKPESVVTDGESG
jgi:predicted component of type VI protein secretion system